MQWIVRRGTWDQDDITHTGHSGQTFHAVCVFLPVCIDIGLVIGVYIHIIITITDTILAALRQLFFELVIYIDQHHIIMFTQPQYLVLIGFRHIPEITD